MSSTVLGTVSGPGTSRVDPALDPPRQWCAACKSGIAGLMLASLTGLSAAAQAQDPMLLHDAHGLKVRGHL